MNKHSTRTWILVAHRAGARILEHDGPGRELRLLDEIDHPDGRKQESEIDSDRSGVLHGPGRIGGHATSKHQSAPEHVAETFAHALAMKLRDGRNANRYAKLVLVAEPHFLGVVRDALDAGTAKVVTATVGKDLAAARTDELAAHLQGVLPV